MCQFASFYLTQTSEFWGPTDSHSDIIEHHGLVEDGVRGPNGERVELLPPEDGDKSDLARWTYELDQDVHADWHEADPGRTEERARAALARRAAEERWFIHDNGQNAHVGYAGTATACEDGTATAGDGGTATAGDNGTATAGNAGTATAGPYGTATAGIGGTILLRHWDGARRRVLVAYVGENGIEANTPYVVRDGKIVKKEISA